MTNRRFFPIIPAGGSGTRLWPLSRAHRPKFLLPLPGPETMIQATMTRLGPLSRAADTLVITGAAHAGEVARQLPELGPDQIVVEPQPRGSGPAIGLGTAIVAQRHPDALVGSFAADHVVERPEAFQRAVETAMDAADLGYLVTIGIHPTYPETGYGYIRAGAPLTEAGPGVFRVQEFKEKPDLATATRYVAAGEYHWNASMFVWRASVLLEEMLRLLPDLHAALIEIAIAWDTPERDATLQRIWPTIQDVTIDTGILERSGRVAVVPADMGWTDLGDWHGFGAVKAGNSEASIALNCDTIQIDSTRSVVYGNGRLIALLGVDNVIVVDTDDAILICERTRAQEVRAFVDELRRRGSTHLI